jgi:CubicO group peptidase (beta-lactamase class C family)
MTPFPPSARSRYATSSASRWGSVDSFDPPGTYPIQQAFDDAGVISVPPHQIPPADAFMEILGDLPLASQPGEVRRYNTPMDVAGVLIARVTGGSLEEYLQDTIFSPLGMVDTGFQVPAAQLDRLTTLYGRDQAGQLVVSDPAEGGEWSEPPMFESGGGGLASTADDLLAFGRMMVNGSRHGNGQFLSDALFEEMTTTNLTLQQRPAGTFPPGLDAWGWGLGLGVITREGGIPSAGSVGWLGVTSTLLISDPAENVVSILLFQFDDLRWFGPVFRTFWDTVYSVVLASH